MSVVLFHKIVSALPDPLEPNSIYYVRVGSGFDTYVTNSSGMIVAYESNEKLKISDIYARINNLEQQTGVAPVYVNPVFTYEDGNLILVTYENGATKTLEYDENGNLEFVTLIDGLTEIRKQFFYTDGTLTSIEIV